MKNAFPGAALAVCVALVQPALAQDNNARAAGRGEAVVKQAGCFSCHNVEGKKVGPSFTEVAARHKGENAEKLIAAMKAKPVHANVLKLAKAEDLKTAANWVLSLETK
jgi:cytochrome c